MYILSLLACHSIFAARSFVNDPPVHSYVPAESDVTNKKEQNRISIVSANLQFSHDVESLFEEIHSVVPVVDIYILQEVTGDADAKDNNSAFLLAEKIGYHAVFTPYMNHPNGNVDFGTAVISRWPIKQADSLILPNEHLIWGSQRMATYAVLKHPDQDIQVISAHLETFYASWSQYERRKEQIHSLFHFLVKQGSPNDLKILAGDFNTFFDSGNLLLEETSEKFGFSDVSQDVDFTYEGLWDMKLDYVFINENHSEQSSLQLLRDISHSDHFSLWLSVKTNDDSTVE